jgi:uncharacterized membrane protein
MVKMRDSVAIIAGIAVLFLGFLVYITPEKFKVLVEFFPMSVAGILVFGLGTFLIIVGLVSLIADRFYT